MSYIVRSFEELISDRSPVMVGILNVTPDSFSDGGDFLSISSAMGQAKAMVEEGAAIIDVGGESTRPNAAVVEWEEEVSRVLPVVRVLAEQLPSTLISVDTTKSNVARVVLGSGAHIVNDVTGFRGDPQMAKVVAEFDAGCVLMFNARLDEGSGDVVSRALSYWERSVEVALDAGVRKESIVLDPGIGFGTTRDEDLLLLASLAKLRSFGFPIMLGASRKRVTGDLLGLDVGDRLETTLATTAVGVGAGIELFRVHDVRANARAALMAKLIYDKRNG